MSSCSLTGVRDESSSMRHSTCATLLVSIRSLLMGRAPGCATTAGAISLSDALIKQYLYLFCLVKYSNCLYNLRMKYRFCTTPDMEVNVKRLRTLRVEHVLTLRELAEAAGVSKDTIWRLENGHSEAHPSTIRKLARTLGVQPKELVKTGGSNG